LLLSSFRLFVLSCFSSAAGLVRGEAVGRVLRIVGQADRGGEILAGVAGVVESAGQGDAAAAKGAAADVGQGANTLFGYVGRVMIVTPYYDWT
jgi:hypothetical protein